MVLACSHKRARVRAFNGAHAPAVAALVVAVWAAPQEDELAERQESVPGVVLPAAWVFGLESRPFNNSTERHWVCSLGESKRAVSEPSHWIVYILECADQTLYTGITNDLDHRINEHVSCSV